MSSAICFNLDQSKILFSGKGLKDWIVEYRWSLNTDLAVWVGFGMTSCQNLYQKCFL